MMSAANARPCGDCAHLSRTIRTRDWETRPIGYCYAYMTWKLRSGVVPECQQAEAPSDPQQSAA